MNPIELKLCNHILKECEIQGKVLEFYKDNSKPIIKGRIAYQNEDGAIEVLQCMHDCYGYNNDYYIHEYYYDKLFFLRKRL